MNVQNQLSNVLSVGIQIHLQNFGDYLAFSGMKDELLFCQLITIHQGFEPQ